MFKFDEISEEEISDEDMEDVFNRIPDHQLQKDSIYTEPLNPQKLTSSKAHKSQKPTSKKTYPQRRIDLHGLYVHEALAQVERFVQSCYLDQIQFALIITGKGSHSPTGEGVIRRQVRHWLEHRHINFTDAPRHLGGSGAFWLKFY